MNIRTLQQIDWIPHIERRSFIFYNTLFLKAYGSLMKKETGFGFTKEMCWFKEDYLTFYRSEKEMMEVCQYFLRYIKEENPKLHAWYKKGKKYAEKENKLLQTIPTKNTKYIIRNYQALIQELGYLFLYLTCIPWYVLYAIEKGLSPEEQQKYQHIQNLFQPFRKTSRHQLRPVLEKIWKTAAELSDRKDFLYFSYFSTEELGHFFRGEKYPTEEEIAKRKSGCLFYKNEKDSPLFLYNPAVIKKIMEKLRHETTAGKEFVEGIVASKGVVRGRVCVVNSIDDFPKFHNGDIIVSINTNPMLMPVLQKCKAIVTDEGGIICHAAIISRELNKPCIIGTKIATKVLKDGDFVEVDAAKGIVKKL